MSPIAVARQPHDLPRRAYSVRHGAGEASLRVEADGARGERNGLALRKRAVIEMGQSNWLVAGIVPRRALAVEEARGR